MQQFINQIVSAADRFNSETWALLAAIAVVTGYLLLRGNRI